MIDWIIKKLGGYNKHQLDESIHMSYVKGVRETESAYQQEVKELSASLLKSEERNLSILDSFRYSKEGDVIDHWRKQYYDIADNMFPKLHTYSKVGTDFDNLECAHIATVTWEVKPYYCGISAPEKMSHEYLKDALTYKFHKEYMPMMYAEMLVSLKKMYP